MSGRLQLAGQVPERLLNHEIQTVDDFICRALRGEPAEWPAAGVSDPETFLGRCRHHGVAALLYHRMVEKDEWQNWPGRVREELEQSSRAAVAQDLLATHYLKKLVLEFADRKIQCIVLKGEALAATLYPEPGTRTRSDSDLFIRIQDISKARQAVIDMGYEVVSPVYKSRQFTVMRPGDRTGNVRFDIHWRILNAPRFARLLPFDAAFRDSIEVPALAPARRLRDIDALLLACMHRMGSTRHDRDRLIWLHDIYVLVEGLSEDELKQFAHMSKQMGVQDVCLDGLLKSVACFSMNIPAGVMQVLSDPGSGCTAESQLGMLLCDWKELSWRDRSALLKELFLPSGQYLLRKYGKSNKAWLPLLYLRQILGGMYDRLSFR